MNVEAVTCRYCGSIPAVRRTLSDGSVFTSDTCLGCLWEQAESKRNRIEEKSGLPYGEDTTKLGPGATDAEIDAEWTRTDAVHALYMSLYWVSEAISSGREVINMSWNDGLLDEPQTEAQIKMRHVRSFLARSGYEEVSVVTASTDGPVPFGREILPDGDPPHWATNIVFRRRDQSG
jgi:hypothetical protein